MTHPSMVCDNENFTGTECKQKLTIQFAIEYAEQTHDYRSVLLHGRRARVMPLFGVGSGILPADFKRIKICVVALGAHVPSNRLIG